MVRRFPNVGTISFGNRSVIVGRPANRSGSGCAGQGPSAVQQVRL